MSEAPKHARHAAPSSGNAADTSDAEQEALSYGGELVARHSHAVQPEIISDRGSVVQKLHDFAENRNPYTPAERLYTDRSSDEISRLDGSALSRPFHLTTPVKIVMGVVVAVAAVAGGAFVFKTADSILNADERQEAALQESLSRDVSLNLPALSTLAGQDDATLLSTLQGSGLNVVDVSSITNNGTLQLVKLADGVDAVDAVTAAGVWSGAGSLDAASAVNVLNGSWMLTVDRSSGLNMNARFADFTSGSPEAALAAAVTEQGLDGTATSEVTQDTSGNTIQTGAVTVGDATYTWQVSVCPLDEVYAISGLPDTAMYVGVRFVQA